MNNDTDRQTTTLSEQEAVARLSHEMLTPLNAIIGLSTMARHSRDIDQIHDSLQKIRSSASQLLTMVNGMLAGESSVVAADKNESDPDTGDLTLVRSRLQANVTNKNILVAEDMEVNREIIVGLLEPLGFEVDCVRNGREAVAAFTREPERYGLILMDIRMPKMNGHEAARAIRALNEPAARRVPIIALSANSQEADMRESLLSGMNEHLSKPVDYGVLLATLQRHLT
jgi:CheY-like chemotaxis protein